MLQNIRAVLFDLDGVVVFTDRFHFRAWKEMADANGWTFDDEVNHRLRGVPRMRSLEIILEHNGISLPDEEMATLADRKNSDYVRMLQDIGEADLVPHVLGFIESLRSRGIKTALCSASKNARFVLDRLGIGHLFDTVVTGNDVVRNKPEPEIFLKAAQRLGLHPFNCFVVEDAEAGVAAAIAAGMRHVGVGTAELLPNASQWVTDYRSIDLDALLEIAKVSRIAVHPWSVVEERPGEKPAGYWESVFALCNGNIGLRGALDEEDGADAPGFFANGLYGLEQDMGFKTAAGNPCRSQIMMNLADWRIIEAFLGDERVNPKSGVLISHRRELDLRRGVLVREFEWESPLGRRVRVTSERLVSMVRRQRAAIRYTITALNFSGEIRILSKAKLQTFTRQFGFDGAPVVLAETTTEGAVFGFEMAGSGLTGTLALGHRLIDGASVARNDLSDGYHVFEVHAQASQGETVWIEKHADFAWGDGVAQVTMSSAMDVEFATLMAGQEAWWSAYWQRADIEIGGSPRDQQAVRFNIFQLRQNHLDDGIHSISATGLTGANYMGWVFWDTEIFMLPFFLHTEPTAARALLEFRSRQLERARLKAADFGLPGALFPWSTINGDETNSGHLVSTAQYHINADIVHALRRYVEATGDAAFIHEYGAELVFETLRFIAAHGRFLDRKGGKFCIHTVCGPDEYNYPVNNNCYTNAMFREHASFAVATWEAMHAACPELLESLTARIGITTGEVETWRAIARDMYLPFDPELGLHEQHDGYFDKYPVDMRTVPQHYELKHDLPELRLLQLQVTKQADVVLLMHVLRERFSTEIKRANYDFYEPRTLHASSLSPSVHGLVAAEIGCSDAAYDYFRIAAFMDLDDVKNNTRDGIHLASTGGALMLVQEGFLGLSHGGGGLILRPRLPEAWTRCACNVRHGESAVRITATANTLRIQLLEGPALGIEIHGHSFSLTPENPSITHIHS